jgi:hypothetical protein
MATEIEILREALERIKAKSEMWQQVAQSTASAQAVPPWWNLGDIAAAALRKAAQLERATDGAESPIHEHNFSQGLHCSVCGQALF